MDSDDEQFYDSDSEASSTMDESTSVKVPSFETLTADQIVDLMKQYIDHIDSVVELPSTTTRILLSHTKWDKQELLYRLTGDDRDKFFEEAHVQNPFKKKVMRRTRSKVTCSICYSDFPKKDIVGVGCGHEFCRDCWRQYLTIKILDDGNIASICCPGENCGIVVDDDIVHSLISDEKTKQKFNHLITNSFVEHNHYLRWCPAPGCTFAVNAKDLVTYRQNCKCKCGYSFCFGCGDETHDPIPCNLMQKWKMNDNDQTIEYLTKYTKGCPKCRSSIEKNGGCNHMTCRKCNHEFCWLCSGNWKSHDKGCNKYENPNKEDEKHRWEHYFKRYGSHKKSLAQESDLMNTSILEKMNSMQVMGKSWHDVQFLTQAVETLWESRKQLMYTYIFAYGIESHNQKEIFEGNQNDLERATEALSQYLEEELTKDNADQIKINVLNKSNYCQRRQTVMQEHIFEGFENNWWTFSEYCI